MQLIITPVAAESLTEGLDQSASLSSNLAEMRLLRLPSSAAIISTYNGDAAPAAVGTWESHCWAKDKSKAENGMSTEKATTLGSPAYF